jgi:hypothetical protein
MLPDEKYVGGIKACIQGLELARSKTIETMNKKVEKLMNQILKRAKELCPVDTGELKKSGEVVHRGGRGLKRYEVRFTAPYAIYVHEILEYYHKPPTQAKFLEAAVNEKIANFYAEYGNDVLRIK